MVLSYATEIGAVFYDFLGEAGDRAFMGPLRREVIGRAQGVVVEIGSGTGRNFPYYHAGKVNYLYAIEPNLQMARRAVPRADGTDLLIEFLEDDAERLPFEDGFADTVVATLVMCTVRRPEAVLSEVKRILKPSGKLLFIEHVRSDEPWRATLQDWATPLTRIWSANCHLNRATIDLIRTSGFRIEDLRRINAGAPWMRPFEAGVASHA